MAEQVIQVLGIVGIKNMGEYNSQTSYEKLNVVTYQGSSYCALKDTLGNLPTNTEYWQLYAEKGATGATGPQGPKPVKGVDYYTEEDKEELEYNLSQDVKDEVIEQIGNISNGSPLPASSISDMIDTTRLYVLLTDGYVYYYDGTQWVRGWVYQATGISENDPVIEKINDNIEELYDDIECISSLTENIYKGSVSNKYVDNQGNINSSNKYIGVTEMTKVNPGSDIFVTFGYDSVYPKSIYVAEYDENKEFISRTSTTRRSDIENSRVGAAVTLNNNTRYIFPYGFNNDGILPENINYIMISYDNDFSDYVEYQLLIKNEAISEETKNDIYSSGYSNSYKRTNPLKIIKETAGNAMAFSKIACLGDSLTEGYTNYKENGINTGGVIDKCSYPTYLSKILGQTVYNFGDSNQTARSWLTRNKAAQCYDGNHNADAYIIGFGANDSKDDSTEPVGTSSDIDFNDYNNNADTFYGNMGKIIQKIKEIQPKAKIFLMTCLRDYHTNTPLYDEATRNISQLFDNCYLIDMRTYYIDYYNSIYYTGTAQVHQTAIGYLKKAYAIATYIDWIIENNQNDFKNIQLIGTNYDNI